ncbi:MAG: S-adenosyl-l-methionine hydroxide adenosyltransferase family protein [Nitrospinales bacterium]
MRPIITLTTDFGLDDPFVGIMKGVILRIAPTAELVDITHRIEPQNVRQAAYTLQSAFSWFPENTVHLVVVDPGVGGGRRALAAKTGGHRFVAPDNGALTPILDADAGRVYELTQSKYFLHPVSATFHGRDVFAPAAAWLARGTPLSKMGARVRDPKTLALPQPSFQRNTLKGEIVHIDRFGNLMSNISAELLHRYFAVKTDALKIRVGGKSAGAMVDSYSRCQKGEPGCILNSWGCLEVFCREAAAAERFKSRVGAAITVTANRTGK